MKTATEWNDILDAKYRAGERQTDADQVEVIEKIQLEAFKAGILYARNRVFSGIDKMALDKIIHNMTQLP